MQQTCLYSTPENAFYCSHCIVAVNASNKTRCQPTDVESQNSFYEKRLMKFTNERGDDVG